MKQISLLILSLLFIFGCSDKESTDEEGGITISGTVGYPQDGLIILEYINGVQPQPVDTFELKEDYTFSSRFVPNPPGYYRLNFYDKQYIMLILDDEDLQVTVDGNNRNGFSRVSGSRDHDFIQDAQQLYQSSMNSAYVNQINNGFAVASREGDMEAMDSLRAAYQKYDLGVKKTLASVIDTMGASLGVVEVLRNGRIFDQDNFPELYENYADLLAQEMPDVPIAQDFIAEVEEAKKLAIGQVAPDIALPNPDGEIVKLSSLRGNYVLVDFWAKWCKPCRMENPNVVRLYNEYNDDGFEVYGVSLDRRRSDWLQAIEEDGLHWTQVSDLKFWNSEAAKLYNINAIPFALLLDPDGVIIGKNLRGKALEDKLASIFEG